MTSKQDGLRSALAVLHSVKGKLHSAFTELKDFEG